MFAAQTIFIHQHRPRHRQLLSTNRFHHHIRLIVKHLYTSIISTIITTTIVRRVTNGHTQPSTAFLSALNGGRDHIGITASPLESLSLIPLISHPYSGAVSSFIGTTRDSFEGKRVTRLTYEAYQPMAIKCLTELVTDLHKRYALDGVVIVHRIGDVVVGEWSVVIHVSSAHRKASLFAVAECIDKIKANVPIWKCEYYTDGSMWKENQEFNKDQLTNKQTETNVTLSANTNTETTEATPLTTDTPSTSPDNTSAVTNGIAHLQCANSI